MKAILVDTTLCTGCRGCQVACKEWNKLPAEDTSFFQGEGYQNPRHLSAKTWTIVTFNDARGPKGYDWVFAKRQCFHCLHPACVSACPVGAMQKSKEGPVTYNKDTCLGCRYCQLACPFNIPTFEWDKAIPQIKKCTMCFDRQQMNMQPACVKSCPTNAIIFGERKDLLKEAQRRIDEKPGVYVNHIFGKDEVGGTCVLYLSNVPFNQLSPFPEGLPETIIGQRTLPAQHAVPYVMSGLGLILGGVSWIINRRDKIDEKQSSEEDKP